MDIPSSQTVILQDAEGNPQICDGVPLPELVPGSLLVRVKAVALNPCDYKMGATFPSPGSIVGNDFAGTVVRIHTATKTHIGMGDIVCGTVHGSNPAEHTNGAFAQYVRAPADLVLRVPIDLCIEQAATIGLGLTTAIVSLWEGGLRIGVSPTAPAATPFPVLVYGASTSAGTMALQLLRLSGVYPVATCSPGNFDPVRDRGAYVVFDNAKADLSDSIRENTDGGLEYALDCIAGHQSVAYCYASICRSGGRYASLEAGP
ncbi:hypothetical protein JX265_013797 [Neoarthrinium moseri]|uniref:Enoyl reductase (ER) domain-containing protein n=1 Tax=Neoarthrinium moseri TaxID=1658444 RepID=A0A9P9W7S9_9PEZI|nr:hypothetical protein JX265_013797 [Neoarthrinium moseri]